MKHEFEIFSQFLEGSPEDVEGCEQLNPPAALQARLRAFAGGTITEAERHAVIGELQAHPQWVPWLAREVKALRVGPPH